MTDADKNLIAARSLPLSQGEVYYQLISRIPKDLDSLMERVAKQRSVSGDHTVKGFGLLTISSHCVRDCTYCGYRASRAGSGRFRLSRSEILRAAENAAGAGVKNLILKSGDDPGLPPSDLTELVAELRRKTGLHLCLSFGEREYEMYRKWRQAGAECYWLRHETCDPHLYRRIKPSMYWVDRVRNLEYIRKTGFSLATGIMVGMPNQSYESLLEDIVNLSDPGLANIVIEPYLPPPGSLGFELVQRPENLIIKPVLPVMQKVIAIMRLLSPELDITLDNAHVKQYDVIETGRLFRAGANALILDFTPPEHLDFESSAPFTGHPVSGESDVARVRESLAKQGFHLEFTAGM